MLQEKEKILEVLKKGRELLADRPELKTMQPEKSWMSLTVRMS